MKRRILATGIALGIALAMLIFHERSAEGFMLTPSIPLQLVSCTIACIGFAMWFKVRGRQVFYSGVGAFITWGIYALVFAIKPSNFLATLIAAVFVGTQHNWRCATTPFR